MPRHVGRLRHRRCVRRKRGDRDVGFTIMAPHLKVPPDRGLPVATWIDLVTHPERNVSGYILFEDARDERYRFRPTADGWSRVNAWWLAEASLLSYWHDDA